MHAPCTRTAESSRGIRLYFPGPVCDSGRMTLTAWFAALTGKTPDVDRLAAEAAAADARLTRAA
jgi:hypothetical protein